MVCSVCSARRRVLLVRRSLQKQENKNGTHRLTTDASRFLFYPVFPRIRNNSWQVLPLRPQCFWAILLSQYRRRTGSGPCTRGRRLRPPKGDFVTKYLFQFARILAFCFLGEILHAVLPTAHDPARYEGEPYVLAADIAGGDNAGAAGWTWYTGAAGWYLRIAAEDLLGLHLRGGVLYPEPHLPAGWPECTVRWRDGAGLLHTIRLRPDGVTVDNAPYDGGGIGKKRPKPYSQDR